MNVEVYKRKESKCYQIRWMDSQGRLHRESTKVSNLRAAEQIASNKFRILLEAQGIPGAENLTLNDLINAVREDYRLNNRRSLDRIEFSIAWILKHTNAKLPLIKFTSQDWTDYASYRSNIDHAKNATINRELAVVRRGYNLLHKRNRIPTKPYIQLLKEGRPRQGFIEPEKFFELRNALPEYLKFPVTLLYYSGWRLNEVLHLEWRYVNLKECKIILPPELSKNDEGRVFYLNPELMTMFTVAEEFKKNNQIDLPWVFLNRTNNDRVRDFRVAWKTACDKVKIAGTVPHDCRRSAARNLIRAGVPQKVAQTILGHKTAQIFSRYNVVSEDDIKEAAQKQTEYVNNRGGNGNGENGSQDRGN